MYRFGMVFAHPDCPCSFENASVSLGIFLPVVHTYPMKSLTENGTFSKMMAVERSRDVIVFEKFHPQVFTPNTKTAI